MAERPDAHDTLIAGRPLENRSHPQHGSRVESAEALLGLSVNLLTGERPPSEPSTGPGNLYRAQRELQAFSGAHIQQGFDDFHTAQMPEAGFQELGGDGESARAFRARFTQDRGFEMEALRQPLMEGAGQGAFSLQGAFPPVQDAFLSREGAFTRTVQGTFTPREAAAFPPWPGAFPPLFSGGHPGLGRSQNGLPLLQGQFTPGQNGSGWAHHSGQDAFTPARFGGTWSSTPTVLHPAESWGDWLQDEGAHSHRASQDSSRGYEWAPGQPRDATWRSADEMGRRENESEDEPLVRRAESGRGSKRSKGGPNERTTRGGNKRARGGQESKRKKTAPKGRKAQNAQSGRAEDGRLTAEERQEGMLATGSARGLEVLAGLEQPGDIALSSQPLPLTITGGIRSGLSDNGNMMGAELLNGRDVPEGRTEPTDGREAPPGEFRDPRSEVASGQATKKLKRRSSSKKERSGRDTGGSSRGTESRHLEPVSFTWTG
jgi:hypothetical protein